MTAKKDKIRKECATCGNEMFVHECLVERKKFCSQECYRKDQFGRSSWNKGLKLGDHPAIARMGFQKGHKSRTNKGRTWVLGPKHHQWKGGVTSENKLERARFRRDVLPVVFKRDSYKCVECLSGGFLHVDHIKEWSKYPELRFNPENCRTICVPCHYKKTFGRPISEKAKRWATNLWRECHD